VAGSHQTLVVAGAAGLALTAAIEQVASAQAAAAHATLATSARQVSALISWSG